VTYILASNIPELIPFVAMVLFNLPLALTVMQILAIDLGTDLLPALALGTEKPEPGVMNRPPRPQNVRLLNRNLLLRAYLWLGMIECALCFVGFFVMIAANGYSPMNMFEPCARYIGDAARICAQSAVDGKIRVDLLPYIYRIGTDTGLVYVMATTIFHMGVIAAQIGNAFACRTEKTSIFFEHGLKAGLRWLTSNRFLLVGVAAEIILINILVYSPLDSVFELKAISPLWWFFIIWYAPVLFLLEEGRKFIVRRRDRRRVAPAGHAPDPVVEGS
jgi:magnesium-transporting ATPase (P-type)